MMVKSQLSKLLSRPLNSDKIDQLYENHTSRIKRTKLSTSFASGTCMASPEEHSGLSAHEPYIVAHVQ